MSQTKAQLLEPTGVFTLTNQLVGVGATFSGDVSIGGTLTKQDVTNVDSVGVVTARSGVNISGGNLQVGGTNVINSGLALYNLDSIKLADAKELKIGSSDDLKLYHNGAHSYIDEVGSGSLKVRGDDIRIENASGLERVRIGAGGGGNTVGISTTNNMVTNAEVLAVYGTSSFKSNTQARPPLYLGNEGSTSGVANALILFNQGGANRGGIGYVPNTGELRFNNQYFLTFNTGASTLDGTERLRITAAGLVGIGTINPTRGPLHVHENSNNDVQIHLTNQETGTTSSDGFTIFSGANAGPNAGFVNRESGGTIAFYTHNGSSVGVRLTISQTGNLTSTGAISDSKGDLRKIPINFHNAGTYTLVAADAGKVVSEATMGSNITVPASVFAGGDAVTIMNHTGNNITLTQGSGVTMYNAADASTGNRTLAGRGFATIFYREHNVAYISGSGLS